MTRPGWWTGLTGRAVLVTCLVALVSVLITAAVAFPLAMRTANAEARTGLAEKAEVAAATIAGRSTPAAGLRENQRAQKVAAALRAQGIETVLIRAGKADRPGLGAGTVRSVAAGQEFSGTVRFQGKRMMIEARPSGDGDGIALLLTVVNGNAGKVLSRLWLALIAGLGAGLAAGVLLARRLAKPIRGAAAAARRLSAGDRTVRLPVAGPSEVNDLSHALNELASALATSEGRQRAFLMSISHELRTPLTTLKGYAEALADGVVGPEGAQRAGQTMLDEAGNLDRLVADLLVLARLEAHDFPLEVLPVSLVALVGSAAEAWGGRCAAVGVLLRTELPAEEVVVHTDPGRLRQVLDGLLENALRVTPPGAPVVLAVRTTSAPAGPGRLAVLEVRDGGPGFTEDDLPVVFEQGALYERYKGVRKVGSGLGLALAARLVTRLGGTIGAGHAPEGGARFDVYLPVYEPRTSL